MKKLINKKCVFCGLSTINNNKYCDVKCIKRAYYLRKNPDKKSILNGNPDFWKTQTGIGYYWEKYVANKLNGEHLPFNKDGIDVRVGGVNYDVKVCEAYKRKKHHGKLITTNPKYRWWVFNKNKPKPCINFYYCICLTDGKPVKELVIPTSEFKGLGITVGTESVYNKFMV
jgi:hypothetical protein